MNEQNTHSPEQSLDRPFEAFPVDKLRTVTVMGPDGSAQSGWVAEGTLVDAQGVERTRVSKTNGEEVSVMEVSSDALRQFNAELARAREAERREMGGTAVKGAQEAFVPREAEYPSEMDELRATPGSMSLVREELARRDEAASSVTNKEGIIEGVPDFVQLAKDRLARRLGALPPKQE